MKRRAIVAANWKMNGGLELVDDMAVGLKELEPAENLDVIVCPSFPYLAVLSASLNAEQTLSSVHLGAQNASEHLKGAFTGEVSVNMLQELQVKLL